MVDPINFKPQPAWQRKPEAQVPKNPSTQGAKVSFQPKVFADLIENQGVRVKVYRSMLCPRVKSVDGREHDISCPLCYGAQFIDRYPIETKAIISSQTESTQTGGPQKEGFVDGNTVNATFAFGVDPQYFTLIELCDFTEGFYQRIQKQVGSEDLLRYPARKINLLVDYDGKEYREGQDFKISVDGNVLWCSGASSSKPADGAVYSIHYDMSMRFRCTRAMHTARFANVRVGNLDQMTAMPTQWQITKDFLVVRKDFDGVQKPDLVITPILGTSDGYDPL